MSKFGWSYPAGAAGDPNAPYNQDADIPDVHYEIQKLVTDLVGDDGLGRFYRACYKGSACGVSIGFVIDGETRYGEDLYELGASDDDFWNTHVVEGVAISGYVEGSEVDLEAVWFYSDVNSDDFFKTMDDIDKEAGFYWDRDNHDWFIVEYQAVGDKEPTTYYGHAGWGEVFWDCDVVPTYVRNRVAEYLESEAAEPWNEDKTAISLGLHIQFYINDSIY